MYDKGNRFFQFNTPEALPTELNERVGALVLHGIAMAPQSWQGKYITADALLREFDTTLPDSARTGPGIHDVARFVPDGERLASVVNKIHSIFGIDRVVEPFEAAKLVGVGAHITLAEIASQTSAAAGELDHDLLPAQLPWASMYFMAEDRELLVKAVDKVHEYLSLRPEFAAGIITQFRSAAAETQSKSRLRQQSLTARYRGNHTP